MKPLQDSGLTAATKQTVQVEVVVLLHVRIGDHCVRIWFVSVSRLAVDLLLGTSVMEYFMKAILPKKRKIVPDSSRPVALLYTLKTAANDIKDVERVADKTEHDVLFRVSGLTSTPANLQVTVLVNSKGSGLI